MDIMHIDGNTIQDIIRRISGLVWSAGKSLCTHSATQTISQNHSSPVHS